MRKNVMLIFDDVVAGTGTTITALTDVRYNEVLGQWDQLAIHVLADQPSTTAFTNFTIDLHHSNDGRNWVAKSTSWVTLTNFSQTSQVSNTASDAGTTPTMALVRLQINANLTVAGGNVHFKIMACMRDQS